jgi:cob(I)alamin adenosyltransferase
MKIYTRKGDDGTTSLAGGGRISKCHIRVEAYGSVDEVIAWIGLIRDQETDINRKNFLVYTQDQLMRCAALLAFEPGKHKDFQFHPDENCISLIEEEIDKMEADLPVLNNFILPGGNIRVSNCHIARCVCRRAERTVIKLNTTEEVPEIVIKILNRLSDYLFMLSRKLSLDLDVEEVKWP